MARAAVLHPVRRILVRTAAAAVLILAVSGIGFLPFAGRYLVYQDPLEKADAVIVLAGTRVERWLEGVELYRGGWAPQIVISPGRIEDAERELRSMGIRFPSDAELARDAMLQMKVPVTAVETIPESLDNTAQEAAAVHQLASERRWTRLIVVTSKYHTRRARFAFVREFKGTDVRILMRASRYDTSTPERWWRHRADSRYVMSELQKLIAYKLGLGT
jgi:uncharacterized SAM-binding protein YcdF (DUF218 family)